MAATRREFLKTSIIAGAGMALPGTAFAETDAPGADSALAPAAQASAASAETAFTRGIGVYPGNPAEHFGPELIPDTTGAYRNLALLRPAYASSSYDYNLTPQLITDGIADTHLPDWIVTVIDGQILPKHVREEPVNHFAESLTPLMSAAPSVELHLGGGASLPEIDRVDVFVVVPQNIPPSSLHFTVSTSDDGHLWKQAGTATGNDPLAPENYPPDMTRGTHLLNVPVSLGSASRSRFYRVDMSMGPAGGEAPASRRFGGGVFRLGQIAFFHGQERVNLGGPYSFTSAWKSASLDEEWVYVDLGARLSFDNIKLHWIARAAEGKLQVSDDAHTWTDLQPLPSGDTVLDDIRVTGQGRYVRVLMTAPATEHGYILSELEVFGHGGFTAKPKPAPTARPDGRLDIAGGSWLLRRAGTEQGETLSAPGYKTESWVTTTAAGADREDGVSASGSGRDNWIVATVPGTVLSSYLNVGALPDPNYGQNQLHISDSFFYSDFWYRTEFTAPSAKPDQVQVLNLDGINWKADVYLNGAKLGHIDGGFMRGRFDVTGKLKPGQPNALAIRIFKNATPGSCKQKTYESTGKNGGALGADNPTFHSSIGWDWIPTIRGRNIGIWNDVFLTTTGAVTLEDPLVSSTLPLPDTSRAEVALEVIAVNHTAKPFTGTLRGTFGTIAFEQRVSLGPNERQPIKLKPRHINKPELWWPAGYGDPHLYDVDLRLEGKGGQVHHRHAFKAGIRQMAYSEDGGVLKMWINGRRLVPKGGNWGFGESMLRYRAREYDAAVRYHREMNFNMIRDWVGQIGDDAFYEACDRHGVIVWQDFWLANPWDGPIPDDNAMFLANARDYISRIRSHASIGIYCGRNEWFPPKPLDIGLKQLLAELHPGIHFIGSSADGPVSGHGPYRALPTPEYFRTADTKLHSEIGAPTIPPIESVREMMPESALWPQGLDWGLHDFTLQGAQGGTTFLSLIEETYGGARSAEEWVTLAQFINYETYRAMFEAQSNLRLGVLLWMSHPCWPSFVWQTYDYYFEPTAAYFACKKACEPLHIQWNPLTENIEVVNSSGGNAKALTATAEIINSDGTVASKKDVTLDSAEDSLSTPIHMEYPAHLSAVHFLRLTLTDNGKVRSSNIYLRGREEGDLRGIRALPKVTLQATTTQEQRNGRWLLSTVLKNTTSTPAIFVRLKAVRDTTGDRILPAIYEDNYITLMPNETRTLTTELNQSDTRGEKPRMVIEGFNIKHNA